MILGPDGKPARGMRPRLETPDWLKREALKLVGDDLKRHQEKLEEMRILELRESVKGE